MPENPLISFRCYYPDGSSCNHFQTLPLCDVPKWIECYRFTHPSVLSISVKVWFSADGG